MCMWGSMPRTVTSLSKVCSAVSCQYAWLAGISNSKLLIGKKWTGCSTGFVANLSAMDDWSQPPLPGPGSLW